MNFCQPPPRISAATFITMSPISRLPANSSAISPAPNMLINPLDEGIVPHVPHWLTVLLCLFLAMIIIVTVVASARTGGLYVDPLSPRKWQRRRRPGFKDLRSAWSSTDTLVNSWIHSHPKRAKSPMSDSEPDMDDGLSRLTQANTVKNQRRAAPWEERVEQTAVETFSLGRAAVFQIRVLRLSFGAEAIRDIVVLAVFFDGILVIMVMANVAERLGGQLAEASRLARLSAAPFGARRSRLDVGKYAAPRSSIHRLLIIQYSLRSIDRPGCNTSSLLVRIYTGGHLPNCHPIFPKHKRDERLSCPEHPPKATYAKRLLIFERLSQTGFREDQSLRFAHAFWLGRLR
ncbi:hypothetical protein GGX14DRAFT_665454 [Mycena pura]|uniref:Uncharacterized protein n=1 Tax=Mycena pura TaxID=153505 RepID=A0AAD6Y697_9AGAR|nr:hypothetical protein GGX14DRAFT_665454 [Mycena pura]